MFLYFTFPLSFSNENEPLTLVLPNQWMWDIIDEFIYQFQSFCQYRAKIMKKSEDEMIALKENVYKVLLFFIDISLSVFEFWSLKFY